MKCRILRWLLGIWLVETVAARHILKDDEQGGNVENRFARAQSHRTFLPDSHLNYNAFRTPIRRAPPQVPGRQDGIEPHNEYSNYFSGSQNQNVYSAVRLHGALEVRARAEPGSNTLVSHNGNLHQNYYHQQDSQKIPERQWRRDVDEDSGEREDDLARFSLYNSYFDNEHSIKALNSMKCVTPTGSEGFCSTFRGCVPSFFTKEGDLEAPALAELISTSIGYCTTNVSHHFIREQRQHALSREDRRFNSVANRIICCPGIAPPRDHNGDPDKIFNDYLESQKNKQKTTTTTTTTTEQPQEPVNVIDGSDNSINQPEAGTQEDEGISSPADGQVSNENGSQTAPDTQQQPNDSQSVDAPAASDDSSKLPEQSLPSEDSSKLPEQTLPVNEVPAGSNDSSKLPEQILPSDDSSMLPEQTLPVNSPEAPAASDDSSMLPEQSLPVNEAPAGSDDSSMLPEQTIPSDDSSKLPEQPLPVNEAPASSDDSSMLPEQSLPVNEAPASSGDSSMLPEQTLPSEDSSKLPEQTPPVNEPAVVVVVPEQNQQEDSPIMNQEAPDMMMNNKPSMTEDAEPSQSQQNDAAQVQTPVEGSQQPGQSSSSPPQHMIPDGASDESSQQIDEQPVPPVNEDNQSSSSSSSPVSNDEATPGSEQPQPSPGKYPPQTQDSHVIKIYPEPVSGVNGKFTLPGGIYIVSTTENPNQPKPVRPVGVGEQGVGVPGETMVDSKPIIIVTNPNLMPPAGGSQPGDESTGNIMPEEMMVPTFPQFPADFPPMGSAESPPSVEDSSLELQQRPAAVITPDKPMMVDNENEISISTSSPAASSSLAPELPQTTLPAASNDDQMNDEVTTASSSNMQYAPGHTDYYEKIPMTTNEPEESVATTQRVPSSSGDLQQPQQQQQQDESDMLIPTTSQPSSISDSASEASQGISASSNSITTTSSSSLTSDENDENGAVTIIPDNSITSSISSMTVSSEKSGPTTQIPVDADFMTTIRSQPGASIDEQQQQQQQQQGVNDITTISSGSVVESQGVEVTTIRQAPSSSAGGVGSSQEAIETTTFGFIKAQAQTTLSPDDDDSSEESDEDVRQKATTVANQNQADVDDDIEKTTVAASPNFDLSGSTTTSPDHQDDELLPVQTTQSSNQQQNENEVIDSTTTRIAPSEHESGHVPMGTVPPVVNESVFPGTEYPTAAPPSSASQTGESEDAPKIVLNPGSEVADGGSEAVKGGSSSVPMPVGGGGSSASQDQTTDDSTAQQQVPSGGETLETVQPFPVSSPAPTGEQQTEQQGINESASNQQQLFPGSESSGAATEAPLQDPEQPIPESEPEAISEPEPTGSADSGQQQPFPEGASTTSGSLSLDDEQPISGTEQSEASSSTSESSPATNDRESTRIPTTGSPINSGIEQEDEATAEAEPTAGSSDQAPVSGSEQSDATTGSGAGASPVSDPGREPAGATSESSNPAGANTISDGSESSTAGGASLVSGTESSVSRSSSSPAGTESPTQGANPGDSGNESFIPNPGSESSSDNQSANAGQGSGSSTSSSTSGNNESAASLAPVEPTESTSDAQPPVPEPAADDSNSSDDELSISSSSPSSTASTTDRPAETENVSQESVPSIPSEPVENAPSMQGPPESADSPVSSDSVQDPEPVIATSEASQNVSSPAPIIMSSTTEPFEMQELSTEAAIPPKEIMPNYQILKACKFQTFFRSASEQGYSYRHYPWLATIVGGTRPFSSGTLITDRHILTASHFLANITVSDVFNMRIHIGYRTSYSGQTEGPYAVRKVRKVIRHKGFSFEKLYNDIAVLVLDRPVRFTEDIYPVCLSSNKDADGATEAIETGWIEDPRTYHISQHHNYIDPHIQKYFSFGYKNITWRLQEAPQTLWTNQECQSNYGFLEKNGIRVTDSMVCAGSGDTRSCAFRGNSGAPLFIRNDKETYQQGITSFAVGCGHFPFVYTRVSSFLPWLDRVVYNSR